MTRNPTPLDDLRYIEQHIAEARRRLHDQQRGQPRSSFATGSSSGGSLSSPVEGELRLNGGSDDSYRLGPDPAKRTLDNLDQIYRRIRGDLALARAIVESNMPRPAGAKQRREADAENNPVAVCAHCTPHLPPGSIYIEQPVTDEPTTVAGNLDTPMFLGRWCYEIVRKTGALPTRRMLRARAAGKRVMVQAES